MYDVHLRHIKNMVHYANKEYSTLLEYSVLMPLSGTITSTDPILVSTLPGDYLPIYCYIEKIYKIVILYGKIFFIRILVYCSFL